MRTLNQPQKQPKRAKKAQMIQKNKNANSQKTKRLQNENYLSI